MKPLVLRYTALLAKQSEDQDVFVFTARALDIEQFATIDRAGRDEGGKLRGFQRPQIASHIANIKDYLMTAEAILPNAIVVAFLDGVHLKTIRGRTAELEIEVGKGKPGFVVDGQQRLAALSQTGRKDFEVFVIGLICRSTNELRKQFILVNSTRPLPKSLIYELLPGVEDLPASLSGRANAAKLIERLNYDDNSSLRGVIRTHTNPSGYITDSSFYRVIINSAVDGAIRELLAQGKKDGPFEVVSNFYGAVQKVFNGAWVNHTPKTSRLVHGTGIAALGYVVIALVTGAGAGLLAPLASRDALVPVLLAGFIGAAIPTVAFITGIRILGAPRAAILATLEPVVGVVLAALLLAEQPAALQLVGGALILVAAALLQVGGGAAAEHEAVGVA